MWTRLTFPTAILTATPFGLASRRAGLRRISPPSPPWPDDPPEALHGLKPAAAEAWGDERARVYERIMPQAGLLASDVLGLDLALDGARLRFFAGNAALEDAGERVARLGSMLDKVIAGQQEAARLTEEVATRLADGQRLREEERASARPPSSSSLRRGPTGLADLGSLLGETTVCKLRAWFATLSGTRLIRGLRSWCRPANVRTKR